MTSTIETTALVPCWRRLQCVCSHCRMPLDDVATFGGWNPHICPDKLRSEAFDRFLKTAQELLRKFECGEEIFEYEVDIFMHHAGRVPPVERKLVAEIFQHAGVGFAAEVLRW